MGTGDESPAIMPLTGPQFSEGASPHESGFTLDSVAGTQPPSQTPSGACVNCEKLNDKCEKLKAGIRSLKVKQANVGELMRLYEQVALTHARTGGLRTGSLCRFVAATSSAPRMNAIAGHCE